MKSKGAGAKDGCKTMDTQRPGTAAKLRRTRIKNGEADVQRQRAARHDRSKVEGHKTTRNGNNNDCEFEWAGRCGGGTTIKTPGHEEERRSRSLRDQAASRASHDRDTDEMTYLSCGKLEREQKRKAADTGKRQKRKKQGF